MTEVPSRLWSLTRVIPFLNRRRKFCLALAAEVAHFDALWNYPESAHPRSLGDSQ